MLHSFMLRGAFFQVLGKRAGLTICLSLPQPCFFEMDCQLPDLPDVPIHKLKTCTEKLFKTHKLLLIYSFTLRHVSLSLFFITDVRSY